MSRTTLAAAILIAVVAGAPLLASAPTALGRQQIKARGLMDTKALVVAKLVEQVKTPDLAYVVFENVRVVRGKEQRKLLVFNHPTPAKELGVGFHRIDARQIAQLIKGRTFLITVGKPYLPPLARWVPLTKENQKEVIARELKPYLELDKNLKLDPWKAVESKSLFVQACALCYYQRYASREEVTKLLTDFAKGKRRSRMDFLLVWEALEHVGEKAYKLEPDLLSRVYSVDIDDKKWDGIRAYVQSLAIRPFERAQPSQHDSLIVKAVNSANRDVRLAALHVLCRRKILGCLPGIRKALAGIPSMFEPAYDRNLSAKALRFQIGKRSVDEVLRLCVAKGAGRNEELRMSFDFLANAVDKDHIKTLRALDDPKHVEIHTKVTKLLIYAGDTETPKGYLRLLKRGAIDSLPYHGEAHMMRRAAAWRKPATWLIANRKHHKSIAYSSSAEVLLHLRDPELEKLILPLVDDDFYHDWALYYLIFIAQEKHRTVFQKYTKDKRAETRAYAWAGLARLGDKDALVKVAELTALAPDGGTRYELREYVLPRIEVAAVTKAWNSRRPPKQTAVESAVHAFVLKQLKGVKKAKAK